MATTKIVTKGYTTTNETAVPVDMVGFNFDLDFRVKKNAIDSALLVNLTSPFDQQETLMLGCSVVNDIYKKTDISVNNQAANKSGVQIIGRVSDVFSRTDTANPLVRTDYPVSAQVSIVTPCSADITSDDLKGIILRALGILYDKSTSSWRIDEMVKGALVPKNL